MPGETLPTFVPDSPLASSTPTDSVPECLTDMFKAFQSGIEIQLTSVVNTLENVSQKMEKLEKQQQQLENEVKQSTKSVTSPSKPGKRRREVPSTLQVYLALYILSHTYYIYPILSL